MNSIYNNLGSSGRSLTNVDLSFFYILFEHIAPVVDLFFVKVRSIFFIFLFLFSLIFIRFTKNYLNMISFLLVIVLISFFNIALVDKIFLFDKLRIYTILFFFPNIVIFLSASFLNNYFLLAGLKFRKIIIIFLTSIFIINIVCFNTNHLITWLYNGNLKSISSNPHIENLKNNENFNFRVATYGFFTNFPLYYNLETIGGYAPVSNQNSRNFWNDFNSKALKKYPSLKSNYFSSFNNNTFLNLTSTDYHYKFDEIFDLEKLAERNTKYIISREPIMSNNLNIIYEPLNNTENLKFLEKIMKLLKSNFEFHDNFYIYEIKDFKDRIFATDLYENSLSIDNLYTYKFENNKYMIDIKTNDNFLIFLNHFFDDNWICIDNTNKKV